MADPAWRRYLRFWRTDAVADVDEELRFHIESRIQEYLASGMTREQARAETLRRFGDVEVVRRACERLTQAYYDEQRRSHVLEELRQDVVYAVRALRSNP